MASIKSIKLRCAFYGRMSTDEQEHSLESQRMVAECYANTNGHVIVDEYLDAGIAGDLTADRRPGFQKMMRDAREDKFDAVLVRDPSRLSRSNSIKGSAELEPLYDAGILILTVSGLRMDLSDMAGRIQLQLWFEMAHADNRNRGLAVANGMLRCARNASWIGSAPYAYKIEGDRGNKRLVLGDEREVKIAKRIFREYASGISIEQIARNLEADFILTQKGNREWCRATIAGYLKNPVYAGDFAFNKNVHGKYYAVNQNGVLPNGKRQKVKRDDWILIADAYPAIVTRDQWNRAQARLSENKTRANNTEAFLLSSRLRCATCDETMHGRTLRSGNRHYKCPRCQAVVGEREAVDGICNAVAQKFDPKRVESELRKLLQPSPQADPKERKRLQSELDRQNRKLVMLDDDAALIQLVKDDILRIRRELGKLDVADTVETRSIDAERRLRKALSKLADLPKAIHAATHDASRRLLQELVEYCQVTAIKTGAKRKRYQLTGGEIVLAVNSTDSKVRVNPHLLLHRQACLPRTPRTPC